MPCIPIPEGRGFTAQYGKKEQDMDVFVSKSKGSKVYHRPGCHYIDRISIYYGKICSERRAIRNGYCACKYCGGTAGLHRMNRKALQKAAAGTKLETFYDDKTSTFYLRTDIGFWKFYWKDEADGYLLYHLNAFDPDTPTESMTQGHFHRQKDFAANESIEKIVKYIADHDRAKAIIADDYRKLPKSTKKQKKYYKQAKKRAQREENDRVDRLFALIANHSANISPLSA